MHSGCVIGHQELSKLVNIFYNISIVMTYDTWPQLEHSATAQCRDVSLVLVDHPAVVRLVVARHVAGPVVVLVVVALQPPGALAGPVIEHMVKEHKPRLQE
jgi:hypothetical protein